MLDFTAAAPARASRCSSCPRRCWRWWRCCWRSTRRLNWAPVTVQETAYLDFGFIPGRLTVTLWPDWLAQLIASANVDPHALDSARMWRATTYTHPGLKPGRC